MYMLTFEKVLEIFKEYLEKDTICEVVQTKQGYTVMYWDKQQEEWFAVTYCKTAEIMRDTFLDGYFDLLEQRYTQNRRNLTNEERKEIDAKCEILKQKCND